MFEIEKDIPIPKNRRRKYPFDKMKVGDSFYVKDERDPSNIVSSLCGCVRIKRYADKKFRTQIENGGVRIWRIE